METFKKLNQSVLSRKNKFECASITHSISHRAISELTHPPLKQHLYSELSQRKEMKIVNRVVKGWESFADTKFTPIARFNQIHSPFSAYFPNEQPKAVCIQASIGISKGCLKWADWYIVTHQTGESRTKQTWSTKEARFLWKPPGQAN